jgi:hypothetical protein
MVRIRIAAPGLGERGGLTQIFFKFSAFPNPNTHLSRTYKLKKLRKFAEYPSIKLTY